MDCNDTYVLLIIIFFMLVLFLPIMIYVANKEAKQEYYNRFSIFEEFYKYIKRNKE